MPLVRTHFDVLLEDPETLAEAEHRTEVRAVDHLRGELETKKNPRLAGTEPMHMTYSWVWAALVREGKFTGSFGDFIKSCLAVKGDKGPGEPVDPTQPAASDDSA